MYMLYACLLQTEIPVDGVAGFHGVDLAISTLPEQNLMLSAQLHLWTIPQKKLLDPADIQT